MLQTIRRYGLMLVVRPVARLLFGQGLGLVHSITHGASGGHSHAHSNEHAHGHEHRQAQEHGHGSAAEQHD